MRSIRPRMRSVSREISWVISRSSGASDSSSSCAAPRMPASGFLISCASTAAMPCIERTAPRAISWRSMRCARLRSCKVSSMAPSGSGSGVTVTSAMRSPWRGVERSTSRSAAEALRSARLGDQLEQRGLPNGIRSASVCLRSSGRPVSKNCSAAGLAKSTSMLAARAAGSAWAGRWRWCRCLMSASAALRSFCKTPITNLCLLFKQTHYMAII